MLVHADEKLSEGMIKEYHHLLKRNTSLNWVRTLTNTKNSYTNRYEF